MNYGKALRKLRTDARLTQQALAERVNVTAQAVSKWENGVNQPDIAMLQNLCAVFNVSVDEFLSLAKEEEVAPAEAESAPEDKAENADAGQTPVSEEATKSAAAEQTPASEEATRSAATEQKPASEEPTKSAAPSGQPVQAAAVKHSSDYPWYFLAGALALAVLVLVLAAVLVFGGGLKNKKPGEERPPLSQTTYYTVTFYNRWGGDVFATREVAKGKKVECPDSEIAGYKFGGWFTDWDCTQPFDFSTKIREDINLYGVFTQISYSISYDANGGTGTMEGQTVSYTSSVVIPACMFEYKGHLFSHWTAVIGGVTRTFAVGEVVSKLAVTDGEQVVLKAVWGNWEYTLDFDTGDGDKVASVKLYAGDSFTLPSATRYGYHFAHWSYNGNSYLAGEEVRDLDPDFTKTSVTLTAAWTPITFTVRYSTGYDHMETGTTVDRTVAFGDPAPSGNALFDKPGYTFNNWRYNPNVELHNVWDTLSTGDPIKATGTQDDIVYFYSSWRECTYYVAYDYDGDGEVDRMSKYAYSDRVRVWNSNAGSRTGMTVDHWVLKTSDGRETVYRDGETFSGAESKEGFLCRMTAVWRPLVYKVVYYNPDGDNVTDQVTWDEVYSIRGADTILRQGYTLTGWSNRASSTEIIYTCGQEVTNLGTREGQSVWLYGVWRAHTYTVRFAAPDADSGNMEEQTFTYGVEQALLPNAFVRTGYYFVKWQLGEDSYRNGEKVKDLTAEDGATVTLTAVWDRALKGEGTADQPYLVSDVEELNKMDFYVRYIEGGFSAHYALTADIDMEGATLCPIGHAHSDSESSPVIFEGTLDGRGHVIKDVTLTETIASSSYFSYAGLFARMSGATVKNLGIEDYSIEITELASLEYFHFRYYVGALAGEAAGANTIENVFASGSIIVVGGSKAVYVGGLAGQFSGTMSRCYASGSISASAQGGSTGGVITTNTLCVGGLVGLAAASDATVFEYCYADVDITGALTGSSPRINDYLGGFLGYATDDSNVSLRYCFSFGDLSYNRTAAAGFGRFIGAAKNARFRSVYTNADAQLRLNNANQSTKNDNVSEAYSDELTDFAWVKANLSFSEEVWTAKEGGLPVLKMFEEGRE